MTPEIVECKLNNMARRVTISDEQILEAAREVFLEEGFKAPTSKIARRAGVSEGSLFNRFTTKVGLFFASIGIPPTAPWHKTLDRLSGKGDLKENLVVICRQMTEHEAQIVPRIMMLWASKVTPPELMRSIARESGTGASALPPVRDWMKLTEFFAQEMALGRMRRCNPRMAAMAFDGAIRHRVMLEMMGQESPERSEKFAKGIVDLLWPAFNPEGGR